MIGPNPQYVTKEKLESLKEELINLKSIKIPELAKRVDEARQMGDLSENAEYHSARDELRDVHMRVKQVQNVIDNAEIIEKGTSSDEVGIGSTIEVVVNDKKRTYLIVGQQEADPLEGKISNESPLGNAFLGKSVGDIVEVEVPAGIQQYRIEKIS